MAELPCDVVKAMIENLEWTIDYTERLKKHTERELGRVMKRHFGEEWETFEEPKKHYDDIIGGLKSAIERHTKDLEETKKLKEVCKRK